MALVSNISINDNGTLIEVQQAGPDGAQVNITRNVKHPTSTEVSRMSLVLRDWEVKELVAALELTERI